MHIHLAGALLIWAAAPIITLSDAQVAALDAEAGKACRAFVVAQYPQPVAAIIAGRVRTFGSDRDHDTHYGVLLTVPAGDAWICLYDRDKRAVAFAGTMDQRP